MRYVIARRHIISKKNTAIYLSSSYHGLIFSLLYFPHPLFFSYCLPGFPLQQPITRPTFLPKKKRAKTFAFLNLIWWRAKKSQSQQNRTLLSRDTSPRMMMSIIEGKGRRIRKLAEDSCWAKQIVISGIELKDYWRIFRKYNIRDPFPTFSFIISCPTLAVLAFAIFLHQFPVFPSRLVRLMHWREK